VFSTTLGIFGIVGAEFLPASLLTPMARDLRITEGMAGQAVTVTAAAAAALVASLLTSVVCGRIDRRTVLTALTAMLIGSNLLVAMAPNLALVMLARVLLGVALGGFWSLSAATMMRLVPAEDVPRALSILFAGVSAATVCAAPFGSFFGEVFGWRVVFLAAASFGAVALAAQLFTLPSMPCDTQARLSMLVRLLRRPGVRIGLLSLLLVFAGHMAFFTYLRPFLETVTKVGPNGVTAVLLLFGIGSFVGNSLSSKLIARSMRMTLAVMPLILALAGFLLATLGGTVLGDTAIVTIWGVVFGIIPVSWSTWVTCVVPDEAESGGGLLVATCNLAIAAGAAGGGWIIDGFGARIEFLTSAAVLALAFLLALLVSAEQPDQERDFEHAG
jgi:predicted MFS family arabinose efflux permease